MGAFIRYCPIQAKFPLFIFFAFALIFSLAMTRLAEGAAAPDTSLDLEISGPLPDGNPGAGSGQSGIDENESQAAASENHGEPMNGEGLDKAEAAAEQDKSAMEQTVYPGTRNASIIHKPVDAPSWEIYYPVFNNTAVDASIKAFAEKQIADFEKEAGEDVESEEDKPSGYGQWDMSGYFNLERPNPDIVSVVFNIYSFTGGAHGNMEIACLNYNLKTGQPVGFADLFKDPEKALEMMSEFSIKKLTADLGEYGDEDMILSGASPDLPNFSNLTLVPDGLYIEFQPYQVGPWAAGPQRVKMTLADLAAAGPELDIWPQASSLPAPAANSEAAPAGQDE